MPDTGPDTPSPKRHRLTVHHRSSYAFSAPLSYGVQRLRLWPKTRAWQTVVAWDTRVEGGRIEADYEDEHHNHVQLLTIEPGVEGITILCDGIVETEDHVGLVGAHRGPAPLWLYRAPTPHTAPGRLGRALARDSGDRADDPAGEGAVARLHRLSAMVRDAIDYRIGATDATTTAEEALAGGAGVCQDHAHAFIAAARVAGFPARYVSGYLLMNDRVDQDATHGWAEAHVDGLGWVGFDISNGISPDHRYVRVATGRDYGEAAPIRGISVGGQDHSLSVAVRVEQ